MDIDRLIQDFGGRDERGRRISKTPKKRRGPGPEARLQRQVLEYLRLKKLFHWRQNSQGIPLHDGSGRMRPSAAPGAPDIFVVKDGRLYGLELKSPTGRVSDVQRRFGEALTQAGAVYEVVRSLEDVTGLGL